MTKQPSTPLVSSSAISQSTLGVKNGNGKQRSGFALIFSLTVILLLVVLVTGLLLFVRAQQRIAQPMIEQMRAEANARLSASLALGQIQLLLGSDLRATAPAEAQAVARGSGNVQNGLNAFNPNRRRVISVFDTSYPFNDTDYPVIGRLDDSGFGPYAYQTGLIDRRYSTFSYFDRADFDSNFEVAQFDWMLDSIDGGESFADDERPQLFRGYLASGVDFDPTANSTDKSVTLYRFNFPDPINPSNIIEDVSLETELIDGTDFDMVGSVGFVVQDLSQQASLRLVPASDSAEMDYTDDDWDWAQKLISQRPSISSHPDLPTNADSLWSNLDFAPLSFEDAIRSGIGTETQWEDAASGFTFTPNKRVLSSARLGGLQRDLSAYLLASDTSLAGAAFTDTRVAKRAAGNASELSGAQEIAPIFPGRFFNEMAPTFEAFRRYARLKNEISSSTGDHYYNDFLDTDKYSGVWARNYQSHFSSQQGAQVGSSVEAHGAHVQRMQPVVLEASMWWTPTREDTNEGDKIFMHLRPKVVLWNPYSVDLPSRAHFVAIPIRFRKRDDPANYKEIDIENEWTMRFFFTKEETSTDPSGNPSSTTDEQEVEFTGYELIPFEDDGGNAIGRGELTDMGGNSGAKIYRDYAVFYLEATTLKAGSAVVFSAHPTVDGVPGPGGGIYGDPISAPYNLNDVTQNRLSAKEAPNGSAYFIASSTTIDPSLSDHDITRVGFKKDNSTLSGKSDDVMLYAVEGSTSDVSGVSEQDIFPQGSTSSYPLIFRMASHSSGSHEQRKLKLGYAPSKLSGEFFADFNNNGLKELGSYRDVGDVAPEDRWGNVIRSRYLDDARNYLDNFGQGAQVPDYFLRHALINQYNMRALAQFRSPSDPYLASSHSSHTVGSWFVSNQDVSLNNNLETGFYNYDDEDNAAASPFVSHGLDLDEPRAHVYFDVPQSGWNPLSLLQFRHAEFNSMPWASSYPLGSGMADIRAGIDSTSHEKLAETSPFFQWATGLKSTNKGDSFTKKLTAFFAEERILSGLSFQSLVRYDLWEGFSGDFSESLTPSIQADILLYDYGYKLNHYLLDDFFLSTLDYDTENNLDWDWQSTPLNTRITPVNLTTSEQAEIEANGHELTASGVFLEGAFNPNSTDVNAWTAFLSSLRGQTRESLNGGIAGDGELTLFARTQRPASDDYERNPAFEEDNAYFDPATHSGAMALTDEDIRLLAQSIVEVNLERGPALTLADFVSRPLINQTQEQEQIVRPARTKVGNWDPITRTVDIPIARRSRLEEALLRSGLNAALEDDDALQSMPTRMDRLKPRELPGGGSVDVTARDGYRRYEAGDDPSDGVTGGNDNTSGDQVRREFLSDQRLFDEWVTRGLAGWITQQDILEPLLPAMTTRGDTFVIRCYGSSQNAGEGARRYLEVTVQRLPEFLHHEERGASSLSFGNRPQDRVILENQETAAITNNDDLTAVNRLFGRRFQVVSQRWMTEKDL